LNLGELLVPVLDDPLQLGPLFDGQRHD